MHFTSTSSLKSASFSSFAFTTISFITRFPTYLLLLLIKNSLFKKKLLNRTITKERRSYLLLPTSLPSFLPSPFLLIILNIETAITMRLPCNMYWQRGSLRILVRHSIYIKCMSLKMHYAMQLNRIFGVVILKLFLIFRELKVGIYMLFKDVFPRYIAHLFFI